MYKLEIEEQAKEDLSTAMFWYETQQQKLGVQLLHEVRKKYNL